MDPPTGRAVIRGRCSQSMWWPTLPIGPKSMRCLLPWALQKARPLSELLTPMRLMLVMSVPRRMLVPARAPAQIRSRHQILPKLPMLDERPALDGLPMRASFLALPAAAAPSLPAVARQRARAVLAVLLVSPTSALVLRPSRGAWPLRCQWAVLRGMLQTAPRGVWRLLTSWKVALPRLQAGQPRRLERPSWRFAPMRLPQARTRM